MGFSFSVALRLVSWSRCQWWRAECASQEFPGSLRQKEEGGRQGKYKVLHIPYPIKSSGGRWGVSETLLMISSTGLIPTPRACSAPQGSWRGEGEREPGRQELETGKGCQPRPWGCSQKKEAGGQKSRVTSSNFITVGKAGVSITSEESRFSKTAAAERSNDPRGKVAWSLISRCFLCPKFLKVWFWWV